MADAVGLNFFTRTAKGSMGVVKNTRYVRCHWPRLNQPTALFADGSSGIEVQGPPTPRNVVFPDDTVFLPVVVNDGTIHTPLWRITDITTKSDCFFTVKKLSLDDADEQTVHVSVEAAKQIAAEDKL